MAAPGSMVVHGILQQTEERACVVGLVVVRLILVEQYDVVDAVTALSGKCVRAPQQATMVAASKDRRAACADGVNGQVQPDPLGQKTIARDFLSAPPRFSVNPHMGVSGVASLRGGVRETGATTRRLLASTFGFQRCARLFPNASCGSSTSSSESLRLRHANAHLIRKVTCFLWSRHIAYESPLELDSVLLGLLLNTLSLRSSSSACHEYGTLPQQVSPSATVSRHPDTRRQSL